MPARRRDDADEPPQERDRFERQVRAAVAAADEPQKRSRPGRRVEVARLVCVAESNYGTSVSIETQLVALAQQFTVAQTGGGATLQKAFQLNIGQRSLTVTDLVTATEIQQAAVDLQWRTKHVRFVNTDITDAATVGGMPIPDLLTTLINTATTGQTSPPGVAGVLGALTGTVPIPIDVTNEVSLAVEVLARWRILDENGDLLSDVTWRTGNAANMTLVGGTGGEIFPPLARSLDVMNLVFPAVFVEMLELGASVTATRRVQVSVRLQAGGTSTDWMDLPPLDVTIPAVAVPSISIFYEDKDFGGLVFIVVPATSPLTKELVAQALMDLKIALDPLVVTLSLLSLITSLLDPIRTALDSAKVTFRKANQIGNLNDIDLDTGILDDTEAEDELSSMTLIGPPRRRMECYNARDLSTSEGQMNVTVGAELIVRVSDLHTAAVSSVPIGRITTPFTPSGTRWDSIDPWSDITGFGDELSSLRWSWG